MPQKSYGVNKNALLSKRRCYSLASWIKLNTRRVWDFVGFFVRQSTLWAMRSPISGKAEWFLSALFSTAVVNNPQQNTVDILCSCGVHLFAHESLLVAPGVSYRAERRMSPRKKRLRASWSLELIFSSVANKQQNQDHSDEWDKSSGDQNRIERVGGRSGTCIGQPADQFECDDGPNSRAGSAQAAD